MSGVSQSSPNPIYRTKQSVSFQKWRCLSFISTNQQNTVIPESPHDVEIRAQEGSGHHLLYEFFFFMLKKVFNDSGVYLGLSCCRINSGPIVPLPDGFVCWVNICLYFSAVRTPEILTKSPTPVAHMHPPLLVLLPCWSLAFWQFFHEELLWPDFSRQHKVKLGSNCFLEVTFEMIIFHSLG